MKVLWVCNTMLPLAARYLNIEGTNKEGWIAGLAEMILRDSVNHVQLAVACPMQSAEEQKKWVFPEKDRLKVFTLYVFREDLNHPENYSEELADRLGDILEDYEPDVVHCFGTEYPHTLALTRVCDKSKLLVGIQGICKKCAEAYFADLPEKVVNRVTFRDFIKKDSIRQQKEKFLQRSSTEVKALEEVRHVTGRTSMDQAFSQECNEKIQYHFMNETLRPVFYEGKWNPQECEKHSIFMSQGDYPLKGLHYMLKAMPVILDKYPDARLYVAGNPIVRPRNLTGKLKISSYGKYIMELLESLGLEGKIVFLGKSDAGEMKRYLLNSNVFVCASAVENSPNSLGEAMLLGVPCVAAEVGGVPSVFRDGIDGIAYPGYGAAEYEMEEDKEQAQALKLAHAILTMWEDEAKMAGYSQNASAHARETHNGEANYNRLLEIYRELMGN